MLIKNSEQDHTIKIVSKPAGFLKNSILKKKRIRNANRVLKKLNKNGEGSSKYFF